jgi:hypothetical protein
MAVADQRGADVVRCWAGFASLGAGLVHAAVVRDHWASSVVHGVFFAVVAAGQLGWGVTVLARDRIPAPRLVAAATVALMGLWAVSRVSAVPFGRESVGAPDLGAAALEVIVVVSLGLHVWGALRAHLRSTAGLLGWLAAGALVVGLITTPALAGTSAGEHAVPHGHHGSSASHHQTAGGHAGHH